MAAPAARPRTPAGSSHTAARDPRRDAPNDNPFHLVTPALEASVVCTSIACDHPKRRYSCGHVDCAYSHENERCLACSVPSSGGLGALRTPYERGHASGVVELLPSVRDLRGAR